MFKRFLRGSAIEGAAKLAPTPMRSLEAAYEDYRKTAEDIIAQHEASIYELQENCFEMTVDHGLLHAALMDIAAMETPSCAHIGKRMAARANEALGVKMGEVA